MECCNLYIEKSTGKIWVGPINPKENLHYASFEGFTDPVKAGVCQAIWVCTKSEPGVDWYKIGVAS